jgi:NTP pyrophosphatase (non-canonical NTP hydrolase)
MSYPLDLGDIAHEINREQTRCWGPPTTTVQALVLCEEAGEVARIAAKSAQGIRPDTRGKWEEELGDVLLVTLGLCPLVGVDPEAALLLAMNKLRRRKVQT